MLHLLLIYAQLSEEGLGESLAGRARAIQGQKLGAPPPLPPLRMYSRDNGEARDNPAGEYIPVTIRSLFNLEGASTGPP